MDRPRLPLNALRAFEAAARRLSITHAATELCVSQAAVSHQIRGLETQLGMALFRRVPRGLVLTEEGAALVPVLSRAFDEIGDAIDRMLDGGLREPLNIGIVTTFATGWLLARLPDFHRAHPGIDLRLLTNNNRVDVAGEGLDMAIRFGNGAWHNTESTLILDAPLTPLCSPTVAAALKRPQNLEGQVLLRSYRADEWTRWFAGQGAACPDISGPVFDSSLALADVAASGLGVALLPVAMFGRDIAQGRLARPFAAEVSAGGYWLTRLTSRAPTRAMRAFEAWAAHTGPIRPA